MSLSLSQDASRSDSHDDLILKVGDQTYRCDSYYLAIEESSTGAVFEALLGQWLSSLEELADGCTCFWPYDFSDQYTGWLRVERFGADVMLQVGWSHLEGWSLLPSSYGTVQPSDWRPQDGSSRVRMPVEECAACIRDSAQRLRGQQ